MAVGSGYTAPGKEFILRDNLPRSVISPEGENPAIIEIGGKTGKEAKKEKFTNQPEEDESSQSDKNKQQNEESDKKANFP